MCRMHRGLATSFDLAPQRPLVIVPASFPAAFAPADPTDVRAQNGIDLSDFQRITLPEASPKLRRPRLPRRTGHLRPSPGLR